MLINYFPRVEIPNVDLTGKLAIVTGANVGIGYGTVEHLISLNCEVVLACRTEYKALAAIKTLKQTHPSAKLHYLNLDLADLSNVRDFVTKFNQQWDKLDLLINNAGLIQFGYEVTVDGFEKCFQINVLGPFLLTRLLIPTLQKASAPRVINVSSLAHLGGDCPVDNLNWETSSFYFGGKSYSDTKLMIIMNTREFAKRYSNTNIKFLSLHPGTVATEFSKKPEPNLPFYYPLFWLIFWILHTLIAMNIENGSKNSVFCAVDEKIAEENNGEYIDNGKLAKPWYKAKDTNLCRALYQRCCQYAQVDEE
jgi:NAD(P)-dependent dehydrogenase (short-subunit alcohol dehydrogenase family)